MIKQKKEKLIKNKRNILKKILDQPSIVCLTAYTAPIANLIDGYVDIILVGDSLGTVLYGFKTTREVSLEMMIMHARSVVKNTKKAINQSYEIQGLLKSLQNGLDIDYQIESRGSPDKKRFMEIAKNDGMKEAIAYRNRRFKSDE